MFTEKKLHAFVIRGQVYEWVKEFLNNRQYRVTINGTKSDRRDLTRVVVSPRTVCLGQFYSWCSLMIFQM